MTDPWSVLGLSSSATPAERRDAYRRLVREHHPDRYPAGTEEQRTAQVRMAEINAAYRMVNDPAELERFRRLELRRSSGRTSARPGDDGVHFSAGDPRRGGAIEPAPGDPDFDYRERAWREFLPDPEPPSGPWTARPGRSRRRRGR